MNDDQALREALDTLVPPSDEVADWEDVLTRAARIGADVHVDRAGKSGWRDRLPRFRRLLVLAGAATALVAAAALAVTAPWRGGPDVVGRAAAALETPAGDILYERITIRASPPPDLPPLPPGLRSRQPQGWVGQARMWMAGSRPRRFRFTITARWRYANGAVKAAPPTEIGGTLSSYDGLAYDSRLRVLHPVAFDYPTTESVLDPAAFVRAALTAHRAKVEGTTVIQGRKAIRIQVRARVYGQLQPAADYFVDAQTYRPIRVVINEKTAPGNSGVLSGVPLASLSPIEQGTFPTGGDFVFDFSDYEHIAATAANRKLTDIEAMHPHAKTD